MSDTKEIERFYSTALKNKIEAEVDQHQERYPLNIIHLCNKPPNLQHSLTETRLGKAERYLGVECSTDPRTDGERTRQDTEKENREAQRRFSVKNLKARQIVYFTPNNVGFRSGLNGCSRIINRMEEVPRAPALVWQVIW